MCNLHGNPTTSMGRMLPNVFETTTLIALNVPHILAPYAAASLIIHEALLKDAIL